MQCVWFGPRPRLTLQKGFAFSLLAQWWAWLNVVERDQEGFLSLLLVHEEKRFLNMTFSGDFALFFRRFSFFSVRQGASDQTSTLTKRPHSVTDWVLFMINHLNLNESHSVCVALLQRHQGYLKALTSPKLNRVVPGDFFQKSFLHKNICKFSFLENFDLEKKISTHKTWRVKSVK